MKKRKNLYYEQYKLDNSPTKIETNEDLSSMNGNNDEKSSQKNASIQEENTSTTTKNIQFDFSNQEFEISKMN